MSALLHIGEADHKLLNAAAEISYATGSLSAAGEGGSAIVRAHRLLQEAHADLGAVRLALRSHALAEALAYHEEMALRVREGARLQRVGPGQGLNVQADKHARLAAALRVLIGTDLTAAPTEGGAPCHVV